MAGLVELKLSGLDGVLDLLKQLPPEVVSKRGGVVKTALRKGAQVILREEALNLARVTGNLDPEQEPGTKLLASSLIVSRGKAPTGGKGERYLVRVKRKAYLRKGKPVTTLKTGQILEYGSEKQQAEPWIRPAFNAKAAEAIYTIERETLAGIDRAVKKLSRGRA